MATDLDRFRENLFPIVALAVVGLVTSVLLLGVVGRYAFGFPILISLLFAAMILPTDPVSVLALFEEVGAPERLSVLVEGESLVNDGVVREGTISNDVDNRLLEEIDLKLDRVQTGESTVREDPDREGYEEFWRARAAEYGLDARVDATDTTDD